MKAKPAYQDPARPVPERVTDLMARMTFSEKLAQLVGVWGSALLESDRFSPAKARAVLPEGIGHISRLASAGTLRPREVATVANEIQRFLIDGTRLGIPAIIHEESCAGFMARGATQFPQAIGLASTWEPGLGEEMGRVIREQMRAVGARQTLAPVLDVARDARWGRCEETFGEDPYLASRFGVACVRGLQGSDLRAGVAATGKHFMGYGASEGGLNWAPCQLPARDLLERVLPPFATAIGEAGLASIMNAYEEIDGVPCAASRWLLTDLLREQLGFRGVVVADYYAVVCLMNYHHLAADKTEAARRSLEAGVDVELPERDCYGEPLAAAVRDGRIAEELVDRAVERVLHLKFELGLFENAVVDAEPAPAVFDTAPQRELARLIGGKAIVLLRNEGELLPLDASLPSIAVIGPSAASSRNLQGDYHYPTHLEIFFGPIREEETAADTSGGNLMSCFPQTVTVLEGIRRAVSPATEVRTAPGCEISGSSTAGFAAAVEAARGAAAAVVVVGEKSGLIPGCTTGEAMDRADVRLPGVQAQLVEAVAATGTPTAVVLINGRPLALADIAPRVPALLEAWLPGEEGGNAIADVLFGRVNPAGRLPITLPRTSGQLPLYYNHKPSGARSQFHGSYADLPTTPLFPFGHGLSYTRFEYANLRVAPRAPAATGTLRVSVEVTNAGSRAGEEVVQLYLCDRVARVTRPVKELKGFARIGLDPGQSRRVAFRLDLRQLAFYDDCMSHVVEPGEVEIMVGASSEDIRRRATVCLTGRRVAVDVKAVPPAKVEVS